MATGLLVVAVGSATRLLRFATDTEKTYTGTVRLGVATDTLDADGEVTRSAPVPTFSLDDAMKVASEFIGPQQQVPPMVSAIKVGGKKLYELAREGQEIERQPRDIVVSRFEVSPGHTENSWDFAVTVTPGTYVRVLLSDYAERLGTLGHLTALRRVSSGASAVSAAWSLEEIAERASRGESVLSPARQMVSHFPEVLVDSEIVLNIRQGKLIDLDVSGDAPYCAAVDKDGELVAVLRPKNGRWQPDVVLASEHPPASS